MPSFTNAVITYAILGIRHSVELMYYNFILDEKPNAWLKNNRSYDVININVATLHSQTLQTCGSLFCALRESALK